MISLIASQTTGSLPSNDSKKTKRSQDEGTDSETEIFNLLPKNRALKLSKKQREVMDDMAPTRCRVFVAFLVLTTLIGFTMLVVMAVFGLWKGDIKVNGFDPLKQTRLVKHDQPMVTKVGTQAVQGYRLPRSLVPRKYELSFHVDVKAAVFSGSVKIEALGESETDRVVLHSVGHEIEDAKITVPQNQDIVTGGTRVTSIGKDPVNGFVVLNLSEKLYKQVTYVVTIKFKRFIPEEGDGFHLASVQAGGEKVLAVTNFEPVYARRMFPCFDEPEMRATFQVTVIRDEEMKVRTLTPRMRSVQLKHGLVEDQFLTTPPIPAYQLWLMIGKMKEDVSIKTTEVTIQKFTTKNYESSSSLTNHAINTGMTALKGVFTVNYPTPKLEIAILPESVKGSGLGFMVLPHMNTSTSPLKKLHFMKVASKKLTKSWLDGLVRINWWTEHWLLSGLSIFISHHDILRKLQPELNISHLFYLTYTQPALRRDQDKMAAVTLSKKIKSDRDVEERFERCYGNKAASVINLLSSAVGKKMLKKGIQDFVKRKKHQGTLTDAFFASLSKFSKWIRVEDPMDNWMNSPGYPVVHMVYSSSKQKVYSFQSSILAKKASESSVFWRFPLKLKVSSSKGIKRVNLNHRKVTFHLPNKFRWLKANFGQQGLYRVKYSDSLWKGLVNQLNKKHTVLPEIDRAGLIDDAMSLARIGRLSYKSALQIAPYLKNEGSFLVWKITIPHFCHVYALFHGHKQGFCVKSYLFGLIRHMIDNIGWLSHGNLMERELRPEILKFSAMIGDKKTIKECKKMFLRIASSKKNYNLPWSLKSLIFKTAIRHGSESEWKILMNLYENSKKHMKLALTAAAASKSAGNIESFVGRLTSSEKPLDNILSFLRELLMNPDMNKLTWKLVVKHWDILAKRKGESVKVLRRLIKATSSRDQLNDAKDFLGAHFKDTKSMVMQALDVRIKETVDERTHRIDIIDSIQKTSGRKC